MEEVCPLALLTKIIALSVRQASATRKHHPQHLIF